jgi:dTMP kinase
VPTEKVALLENFVQGDVRPDLTLLLDAPIEVGMARAKNRGALDRFEEEQAEFFNNVRENYLTRAKAEPDRFKVVDATQSLDEVQTDIAELLAENL